MEISVTQDEESLLDSMLFYLTGVGERDFLALARQEVNPWEFVSETLEYVTPRLAELPEYEDVLAQFTERCEAFTDSLDAAITSEDRELTREQQFEYEPQWDTRYSQQQFRADVWGIGETAFVESESRRNSRQSWRRTVGNDTHLRALTEWGTFSFDITKKWADSKMRVRINTRKGVPFLGVGAVQVNLHNGEVRCWVSGCRYHRQLRNNPAPNVYADGAFDREFAEFQVMSILAHLGYHTEVNPENYWTPIYSVSRYRDDPDTRRADAAIAAWNSCQV